MLEFLHLSSLLLMLPDVFSSGCKWMHLLLKQLLSVVSLARSKWLNISSRLHQSWSGCTEAELLVLAWIKL